MEQPPGTSLDYIQSQDLPDTSSIPTVLDLTSRTEECTLNASSLEASGMVKAPSWYSNSVSSVSLPFSEAASTDHRLQIGDHIQPDNAFSNTTVTLSYVSRSHVFSTQDSLSQHLPRYGVPPVSKLSLHSASHDSEKGHRDADQARFCMERNPHYLDQVDRPLDLASQTELFSFTQAQVGENACQSKKPLELNGGGFVSSDGRVAKHKAQQLGNNINRFQNRQDNIWLSPGVEPLEPQIAHSGEESSTGGDAGVLFLISKTEEPVNTPNMMSSSNLCSFNREHISTMVDPMSPSATCLDDVGNVFILPQASDSHSANDSFVGEASDAAWEADEPAPPSPQRTMSSNDDTPRSDGSGRQRRRKDILEPIIDLTEDLTFLSDVLENESKAATTSHLNGKTMSVQKTFERKRLPARPGRGTRLEAIVMNIHPGRYRAACSVSPNKKAKATSTSTCKLEAVSSKKDTSSVWNNKGSNKKVYSVKLTKPHAATSPVKWNKDNGIDTTLCIESTSDSKIGCYSTQDTTALRPEVLQPVSMRPEPISAPPNNSSTKANVGRVSSPQKWSVEVSSPLNASSGISSPPKASNIISSPPKDSVRLTSPQESVVRVSTPPTVLQKKSPSKPKSNAIASKASPTAKTKAASAPKRKRKKYRPSQSSSMFAPPEPEIKLKYINYKEERREHRADNFSPFVRVELKPSSLSLCTVVNDPEEEQPRLKKGQPSQGSSGAFIPGAVPSTSCLQLGRLSSHSKYHSSLVCCLCGKSANALDLGDLHGPYYPEGFRPSTKTPASIPGRNNNEEEEEKEDEEGFSDSDSSCNMKGRGGKSARLPGMWHHSAGPRLNQQGLLRKHCRWTGDSEPTGSPAAKRARTEAGAEAAGTPQNWYSAPVVPLEPCEYWLHEDCGIWSADVFLVKGKVYGLEEAVKVAQETTCSSCHNAGATLGCFFKGCPNKYHYRCALQSDCVLIEENFTMKCKKHRNKSFKSPPVTRRDDR